MSSRYPPLTAADVRRILSNLGFELEKGRGGAHEQWRKLAPGQPARKVTLSPHHQPFKNRIVDYMATQAGVTKAEFYAALKKV
jgi:predicted RNA binding protein YcfA (HicA-like mRNA interferase family)